MRVCIVGTKATKESATRLSKAIGGYLWFPYHEYRPYGMEEPVYFNYGCSKEFLGPMDVCINPPEAIRVSTDKIKSYIAFSENGVNTCKYVTNEKKIPKSWDWVVCREVINGRNCEGVTITQNPDIVRGCPLYTEFFEHDEEHRIIVFQNKIVARYMKSNLKDGQYDLQLMEKDGYYSLDRSSIKAARTVGLQYAGVDVLYNSRTNEHIVLEINSGPLLTDEVEEFFINHFKGK